MCEGERCLGDLAESQKEIEKMSEESSGESKVASERSRSSPPKSLETTVAELCELIEETRRRAMATKSDERYIRFAGVLSSLYGTLGRILSGMKIEGIDQEELRRAVAEVLPKRDVRIPRKVHRVV